jgi:hypothetical protein
LRRPDGSRIEVEERAMTPVAELWLPIVVSVVAVFVASGIVITLPYHRSDWKKLGDEDGFLDAVRGQKLGAGTYMFPSCAPADVKTPEGKARFEKGPWGTVTVLAGKPSMGSALPRWLAYLLLVSSAIAFLVGHFVPKGGNVHGVFHQALAAAAIVYGGEPITGWIWEGKPGSFVAKSVLDGVIYAFLTAAVFAWLWPHA